MQPQRQTTGKGISEDGIDPKHGATFMRSATTIVPSMIFPVRNPLDNCILYGAEGNFRVSDGILGKRQEMGIPEDVERKAVSDMTDYVMNEHMSGSIFDIPGRRRLSIIHSIRDTAAHCALLGTAV